MVQTLKVFFEMTTNCNYKCIYCFAPKEPLMIISMDTFCQMIDQLVGLPVPVSVLLEGGEPLLIPNIAAYGMYANTRMSKTTLGTNASLVSHLPQVKIEMIGRVFGEVSVGFDTPDPEIFEVLTCSPIDPAIDGIRRLVQSDISVKVCSVVTKYNTDVKSMIDFCEQEGIDKLRFYWFISRPNIDHRLKPTDNDYSKAVQTVQEYSGLIDVKIRKSYPLGGNIVVSTYGEVFAPIDAERSDLESVGNTSTFVNHIREHPHYNWLNL